MHEQILMDEPSQPEDEKPPQKKKYKMIFPGESCCNFIKDSDKCFCKLDLPEFWNEEMCNTSVPTDDGKTKWTLCLKHNVPAEEAKS